MNSNDTTPTMIFTLVIGLADEPDADPLPIAEFDMPTDIFEGGLSSVALPGSGLSRDLALAGRTACQAIDKALKRHIERGCVAGNPEMLSTRIAPTEDLEGGE